MGMSHDRLVDDEIEENKINSGFIVMRYYLEKLISFLEEAHGPYRYAVVKGRNHSGDGSKDCSYCIGIRDARRALRKYQY